MTLPEYERQGSLPDSEARLPERHGFREENRSFWIAPITQGWYVACFSNKLGDKPLRTRLLGKPIVLFRGEDGAVGALLDRCPHRNVPLSLGRVVENRVECRYHGWQFDVCGNRVRVPGLCGRPELKKNLVPSFPVREQEGLIWVYASARDDPETQPFRLPQREGYTTVRRVADLNGSLFACVENALDVPHTAFLHRGYFRGRGETQSIKGVIARLPDRIEVEYFGERPPQGWAARLMTSSNAAMTHCDRFVLPSITQVEYRLGDKGHITTFFHTPMDDFVTRVFAVFQFRLALPGWLARSLLEPLVKRIIQQDMNMLKEQANAVSQFGEERFTSTELDALGLQIWRLMRSAALGAMSERRPPSAAGEPSLEIELKI